MLGQLIAGHRGLAVAGTHGKSTTTAMAAEILVAAGCDPTVIYGAAPRDGRDGGRAGNGNVVLVEACEFRQNFLHLRPHDAVILNIEPDHFDCYDSREALEAAFARFAALLPADGRLIVPWGDAGRASCRCRSAVPDRDFWARTEPADWVAAERARARRAIWLRSCAPRPKARPGRAFRIWPAQCTQRLGRCRPGGRLRALPRRKSSADFRDFAACDAAWSRWERRAGSVFGTITRTTPRKSPLRLQTIREVAPQTRRICCLFQPHQALRTARLLDELALSLQNAERVLIADIFRAREGPPQPGEITAADLAARTRALGQDVPGLHAPVDIQQFLQTHLTPGDVLVVMGAGDIGRIGYGLLDWFREHRAAG